MQTESTEIKGISIIPQENRMPPGLRLLCVNVTPQLAKQILENHNKKNRPVSEVNVINLKNQILAKEWDENNGDTIKISESGVLQDGQHRLHAVIEAGIPVVMHFLFHCSNKAMNTLDDGRKRSAMDVLMINNKKYSHELPGVISYQKHAIYGTHPRGRTIGTRKKINVSNKEILRKLELEEDWYNLVMKKSIAFSNESKHLLSKSLVAKHYNIFARIDKDLADAFFKKLALGTGLEKEDACYIMRNLLINDKSKKFGKLLHSEKDRFLVMTWNYYFTDTPVVRFSVVQGEPYPTIQGIELVRKELEK